MDELGIKHGTDKASQHPVFGHDYMRHYEKIFGPLREKAIKLLEIGVGSGESIRTWLEYFSQAKIYGVDKVTNTNDWNTPALKSHERYTFVGGDQTDPTMWKCLMADHGDQWDVIIDDGGHCNNQIIEAFKSMWPYIVSGGLYCIEDLGVSYGAGSVFVVAGWPNHMDFIRSIMDEMNSKPASPTIPDWFHFSNQLIIMKKP